MAITAGAKLQASDLIGGLVQRFASYSALTATFPSPFEGQMATTTDYDLVLRYDGTAWRVINTPSFADEATRNSNFPNPYPGARSVIGSTEYVFNGSAWAGPAFASWVPAADQVVTSGVFTVLNLGTELVDDAQLGTNASGAITLSTSGTYEVAAAVVWGSGGTAVSRRTIILTRNCPSIPAGAVLSAGEVLPHGSNMVPSIVGLGAFTNARSAPFSGAAGDVIRAFVYHDASTSVSVLRGSATGDSGRTMVSVIRR